METFLNEWVQWIQNATAPTGSHEVGVNPLEVMAGE